MVENDETNDLVNVAKFEHFLGNMKDYENHSATTKNGTPKRLIITIVFEEKSMLMLQDKNQALQECL